MYREPHDQTVNRHLVVGWGWAVSLVTRTYNLNEIYVVLLVPYFDLYLSAMTLILSDKYAFENQKGTKTMLQAPRQRTLIETFQLRVQGLPLASDGGYEKHDA